MSAENHKYENLVFEGGGVKGSAYAGAVQVLHDKKILPHIKHVAGTSAGSMTAALLAVGAGSKGLTESIKKTDFEKFVDDPGWVFGDIYRTFWKYGIHSGDGFSKIMKKYIHHYTNNGDITFRELDDLIEKQTDNHYKHLTVMTSNITTQRTQVFNSHKTPNVPIWQAVRCSMSIPILFEPFNINGQFHMDGGLADNYPIDTYDEKKPDGEDIKNPKTLGFYLEPKELINNPSYIPPYTKIDSLISTVEAMFNFMFNNANRKHLHPGDKERTVFIDDLGVSAIDFSISDKKIDELIASGKKATEDFFK